jgi:hypothetical protein
MTLSAQPSGDHRHDEMIGADCHGETLDGSSVNVADLRHGLLLDVCGIMDGSSIRTGRPPTSQTREVNWDLPSIFKIDLASPFQ